MKRYRIYTGPEVVNLVADRFSRAGYRVYCVGTEHFFIETDDSEGNILSFLGRQCYSHRDIQQLI